MPAPFPLYRRIRYGEGSPGSWHAMREKDYWPQAWLRMGYAVDLRMSDGSLVTVRNKPPRDRIDYPVSGLWRRLSDGR